MLVVTDDREVVEADLAAGKICCPGCGGPLQRWGFAPERVLRTLNEERRPRPRRAICSSCGHTQVLEPASTVPRLRDTAEVVGAAWQAKVAGAGHRQVAARLGRPVSTVRRWLRRLSERAEALRAAATTWLYELDPSAGPLKPTGSALSDALEAVGQASRAVGLRLGPWQAWSAVVALTSGLAASSGQAWATKGGYRGLALGRP